MKTFFKLREELSHQLDEEAAIHPTIAARLMYGHGHSNHNGHEGASVEHRSYADDHKGTPAGKYHAKAALHHDNAINALHKGNMTTSLKHSKLAADAAKKAHQAGGNDSGSGDVHKDHNRTSGTLTRLGKYDAEKKADKKAARANPVKATIGKTISKVKKAFR